MLTISPAVLGLLVVAVAVGGLIQGVVGIGFALVAVPAFAIVEPDAVPVVILVMAVPMTAFMAARERHAIDLRGFAAILVGRVVGIAAGVALLEAVPADSLALVIGAMILVAVGLSVVGLDLQPRRTLNVGAGVLSGLMGTTSAIGGPALALVYQRRPAAELRSTLALSYLAGLTLSLSALAVVGRVERWHVATAVVLLPGLALGLWLSVRWADRLRATWLRPAVLSVAGAAGAVIVVRALV